MLERALGVALQGAQGKGNVLAVPGFPKVGLTFHFVTRLAET